MARSSFQLTVIASILSSALLLTACGGGGASSSSSPSNAVTNPPTISTQPSNQSAITGATATFSVTASGTNPTYQWLKNGAAITGATSSSYTTNPVGWQDNGTSYTVTVSNSGGSVTSSAATLNLQLSADQQIYEALNLAPSASYNPAWNQPLSGTPTSGYYFVESHANLTVSPLTNGPQSAANTPYTNLAKTLSIPGTINDPSRLLINGAIIVEATPSQNTVTYSGSNVRVDEMATDGKTIAVSYLRSGFTNTPLTGTVNSAPTDLNQWFNGFYYNPVLLSSTATWNSGSAYVKFTEAYINDTYYLVDNAITTTTANVDPYATNTTLAAVIATGAVSSSDGVTYNSSNGTISTIQGLPVYVATNPRPNVTTTEYRIYVQLNNNVYTGYLIKNGTIHGGNRYPVASSTPPGYTFNYSMNYQIRINQAATSSLQAAYQY